MGWYQVREDGSVDTMPFNFKGVEIQSNLKGEPGFVGDLRYTAEALVNLLKNAVEHTAPGGTVTVSAKETAGSIAITIADTGEGGPVETHSYEEYRRIDSYLRAHAEYFEDGDFYGCYYGVLEAKEKMVPIRTAFLHQWPENKATALRNEKHIESVTFSRNPDGSLTAWIFFDGYIGNKYNWVHQLGRENGVTIEDDMYDWNSDLIDLDLIDDSAVDSLR